MCRGMVYWAACFVDTGFAGVLKTELQVLNLHSIGMNPHRRSPNG